MEYFGKASALNSSSSDTVVYGLAPRQFSVDTRH